MRKTLLLLVLLALPRPAQAAISLVCSVSVAGANGGTTASTNCSGANLFVVGVTEASAAAGTVSDSTSATWSGLTEQCVSTPCNRIFYAKNVTGNSSQTFTLSCSSCFGVLTAMGFSGADTTAPFDVENGTGGGGFGTTANPGSITPGSDNEVVVTSFAWNNSQTISSVTGYTIPTGGQTNFSGGSNYGGGAAYNIQTTATATNPTWNLSPGTTAGDITVASFKAGAGGGGPPGCKNGLLLMHAGCELEAGIR